VLLFHRVRIGEVAAGPDEAMARLHPREQALAARLQVPKRRHEFLAGRLAARELLVRIWGQEARGLAVLVDEGACAGAPLVCTEAGARAWPALALSISHGAGWACAGMTFRGQVGIDIERIEPRHPAFVEEAFLPAELGLWSTVTGRGAEDPVTVTLGWCVKEALLKLAGVGLRAPLGDYAALALRWPEAGEVVPHVAGAGLVLRWAEVETVPLGRVLLALNWSDEEAMAVAWRETDI
jgi:phosphopantetheinyl transferase